MKSDKRGLFIVGVSLSALALHFLLYVTYIGRTLEWSLIDFWFLVRGALPAPKEVVIVSVDEESYKRLGISPLEIWPRKFQADLLHKLSQAGARAAIIDFLFAGHGPDKEIDERLAQAMQLLPTVIASDVITRTRRAPDGLHIENIDLKPQELFASKVKKLGRIKVPLDNGVVRRFKMSKIMASQPELSLAEAAATLYHDIITFPAPSDFINYYGPAGSIISVPFHRALDHKDPVPAEVFRDRLVFVGSFLATGAAAASKDTFTTPFYGDPTFGAEIHATAAANLINNNWIRRLPLHWEFLFLHVALFIVSLSLLLLRPKWSSLLLIGVIGVWAIGSYYSFRAGYFVPGLTAAAVVLPLVFIASCLYYYFVTYRAQHQIRAAFGRYLSPQMVDKIAEEPEALRLGGQLVEATVFFSDITGFTSMAEKQDPRQLCSMLNRYFTEVADLVLEHNGTLLKFIGDGLFALWGAPVVIPGSEKQAVQCALLIQEKLRKISAEGALEPIQTRIGIHRGNVVIGNLGSQKRFDYTAVGDAVNLASRLEQLNKHLGTSILVSEAVIESIAALFNTLPIGLVRVYGKDELIRVFTVLPDLPKDGLNSLCAQALRHFEAREWADSLACFARATEWETKLAGVASLYQREITKFERKPPGDDWRGEIIFIEK